MLRLNPCANADAMLFACKIQFWKKKIRFFPLRDSWFLYWQEIQLCYITLLSIFHAIICQTVKESLKHLSLKVIAVAYKSWSLTRDGCIQEVPETLI